MPLFNNRIHTSEQPRLQRVEQPEIPLFTRIIHAISRCWFNQRVVPADILSMEPHTLSAPDARYLSQHNSTSRSLPQARPFTEHVITNVMTEEEIEEFQYQQFIESIENTGLNF